MTWAALAPFVEVLVWLCVCALGAGVITERVKPPYKVQMLAGRVPGWRYRWLVRTFATAVGGLLGTHLPWPDVVGEGWGSLLGLIAGGEASHIHSRVWAAGDAGLAKVGVGVRPDDSHGRTEMETGALRTDEIETLGG